MPIAVGQQPIAWLAWAAQEVHRVFVGRWTWLRRWKWEMEMDVTFEDLVPRSGATPGVRRCT
jgi:hypothetical protein